MSIRSAVACPCLLLAAMGLAACQQSGAPGGKIEGAAPAPRGKVLEFASRELRGGDAQAWLTSMGDLADANFCDEQLRPSFAAQPVWTYEFTGAELGASPANILVHFDGRVVGSANSSSIFCLDALTGALIDKRDDFVHDPTLNVRLEYFSSLAFAENGCLVGSDSGGRYYLWSFPSDALRLAQVTKPVNQMAPAFVVADRKLVGSFGSLLEAHPLEALEDTDWTAQLNLPTRGVVLRGRIMVAWTRVGTLVCLDLDGRELWRSDEATRLQQAMLSPDGKLVFVLLDRGELLCRDTVSGELLWRHSWLDMLPEEDYDRLVRRLRERFPELNAGGQSRSQALTPTVLAATPGGLIIGLQSGHLQMLDNAGKLRWAVKLEAVLDGGICFRNAVLVQLRYEPIWPQRNGFGGEWPFLLDAPDWPEIEQRERLEHLYGSELGEQIQRDELDAPLRSLYTRLVQVNLQDGKLLPEQRVEKIPSAAFIPAKAGIVVAEESAARVMVPMRRNNQTYRIVCYNWLESQE